MECNDSQGIIEKRNSHKKKDDWFEYKFFLSCTIYKWKRVSSRRDLHKYISFIPL